MANLNFFTGGYYHIFNRGVEKRNIFLEEGDFLRFVHYLYILNDDQPLSAEFRQRTKLTYEVSPRRFAPTTYEVSPRRLTPRRLNRKRLVDILAFCLMPNHYHLFVEQKIENGISKFMQKLGTAESMFFNAKYEHTGSVFQGKFKFKKVKNDAQVICLANYIHINPIDLIEPGWKENGIKNSQRAMEFLENYRWSSHLDYVGKKNFPSVIDQEFLRGIVGGSEEFKKIIKETVFNQAEFKKFFKESDFLAIE